jgi:anaerobic magnesium-protoporphyrin IX monomethyl ester cyclase
MNIVMLNPPPNDRSWYRVEHLGIAYLTSALRQVGNEVLIIDSFLEDIGVERTTEVILQKMPNVDLIGITASEPETLESGVRVIKNLNNKGLHPYVTAGGYLPTFWSEKVLNKYREIDSVVMGEGEETIKELVKSLKQQRELTEVNGLALRDNSGDIKHTPARSLIRDLDQIPFPARDYLPMAYDKYHHAVISGSRGCYYNCSFCQIAQFYRLAPGKPCRTRSAKNIADEIEILINDYGVDSIFFVDDEFITHNTSRRKVINDLIDEIINRKLKFNFTIEYRADTGVDFELLQSLKKVGLSTVFIGVESGVEEVLRRFDKGIKSKKYYLCIRYC